MARRALSIGIVSLVAGCGEPASRNMSADEVAAAVDQVPIAPGQWEIASAVVDVGAPNLPVAVRERMIGPRATIRSCVTPEQAARPGAGFLAAREDDACSYADFAMRDGRMTGTMRCAEPGGETTLARMTGDYRREAYALRMTIETPLPDGEVMRIETLTRGRHVGACSESARPAREN